MIPTEDRSPILSQTSSRALDLATLVVTAPVWAPALGATALVCRFTQGPPVFFRQTRVGRGGEPYEILKFRTMIKDADSFLDDSGRPTRSRVTPTGRILRRFGFDELPQVLHVVSGRMSLVGPRPVLPSWVTNIPGGLGHARFSVRPGLTGPAQVSGRNTVLWSRRLELDAQYALDPSPKRYISTLIGTPIAVLKPTVSTDRNGEQVNDLLTPMKSATRS